LQLRFPLTTCLSHGAWPKEASEAPGSAKALDAR
jgi:hypothetical protein